MPFFVFTLLLIIWEISSRLLPHLLFVLPSPSSILATFWENKGLLLFHSSVTFKEMCLGFLLALTASFPLAWIMLRFKASRAIFQPLFICVQCLPMFTLAPLMIFWFGWSLFAIVVPTALMIFFPLTLNIYQGLRATPQELVEFFESNDATEWQTFFKLRLPWARPHIFAGLRIGAAIAGIGAIAGEWAGGENGLGLLMLESRRNTDLELTFSALLSLALMTLFFYGCTLIVQRKNVRLLVPLMLVFLSGCHKEPPSTRLLLDWLPCPHHTPLYVGCEKGFFAEEGICLEIQKLHENGGISYLTSGRVDLIVGHMPSVLKAASKGASLKIVGTLIKEPLDCLLYLKEKNIHQLDDLSGKIAGYCLGNSGTQFFEALLKEGKISPRETRNVDVDLIAALGTKRVDFLYGAYWNTEPFHLAALGVETGFFKLKDLNIPPYYELIIVGTKPMPSFQRALQKSIDFCKAHPDEAFTCYRKHQSGKREKTLLWEERSWEATLPLLANDQTIDNQLVENFATWMHAQNLISNLIDYKQIQ